MRPNEVSNRRRSSVCQKNPVPSSGNSHCPPPSPIVRFSGASVTTIFFFGTALRARERVPNFIGGSPSGTAGGVKTVTVFVLLVSTVAVIKNKRTVDVFNRQVSTEIIKRSVSIFTVSLLTVIGSTLLLIIFNGGEFIDILYETISAAATVGLSRNYTSTLNTVGKIIITLTMYLGRVGPISLAFAFSVNKSKENLIENPVEEISVG